MRLDVPRPGAAGVALQLPRVAVSQRTLAAAATAVVGAGVFGVYLTTLAPSVMWYDMGEFATVSATLGIAHNTGYPLLVLLGKLFTLMPLGGDAAYRVNLMSALFTALAIAIVFATIRDLTGSVLGAAAGALTLAFGSTVWANATWATSYGLNLFFTALITRMMLSWWRDRDAQSLIGAALAFGLGMCNHRLIVLVAPPSVLLLVLGWRSLRPKTVLLAAGAFALGLSVYVYLPIRGSQHPVLSWAQPANWHTYWSMFLNGQTPSQYWGVNFSDRISVLWEYPSYDLTWAGLALAGLGAAVCAARQRAVAAYLLLLVALDAVVVETYGIHNIYNYLTPGYLALCVLLGVGCAWMPEAIDRISRGRDAAPAWVRTGLLACLLALLPASLIAKNHAKVDRSNDYAARDFAQSTLDNLPPRAVVMADSWAASPLWYLQLVEGQRPDVIVSPIFSVPGEDVAAFARRQMADGRPVYAADGLRTPIGALASSFIVQPILLNGIEEMIVDTLPKPEYRDDLVMTGSLYKLREAAPDLTVASVPADAERDIDVGNGVTLAGFQSGAHSVERGSTVEMAYYWRADAPLTHDLSAVTLFFDASGHAANVRGFPLWSQPRELGQGVLPASAWPTGAIVRESYFVLVPRTIAPGAYDIRITVFDGAAPQVRDTAARNVISIGKITVN
jgi:hypothetical protein